MKGQGFKWFSLVVAAVWFLFAGVQLNAPDPLGWVIVYGYTGAWTGVQAFRRMPWSQAAVWGVLCAIWAAWILGSWDGSSNPMAGPGEGLLAEEVVRESLGLVLIAAWMGVLAVRNARLPVPVAEASEE